MSCEECGRALARKLWGLIESWYEGPMHASWEKDLAENPWLVEKSPEIEEEKE